MKLLVVYDGTVPSKDALRYGLARAHRSHSELVVLSVFDMERFIDYDAVKAEEKARAEASHYLAEAREIIRELGSGLHVSVYSSEGDAEDAVLTTSKAEGVAMIIVPPRYKKIRKRASVPVTIVPGTLLVPVDSTNSSLSILDQVIREAKETSSRVILLGIIPVHMYSEWEAEELAAVRTLTDTMIARMKELLRVQGIQSTEMVGLGYPDVEILKAADEYSVSMIIFPGGGKTPSELRKAAHLIMTEQEHLRMPVMLFPSTSGA